MSDYETLDQLLDTTSLVLAGMTLMATVVFAYITAAFFFLHRAPLITKLITYCFSFFPSFLSLEICLAFIFTRWR